jgi:hypothetical protein
MGNILGLFTLSTQTELESGPFHVIPAGSPRPSRADGTIYVDDAGDLYAINPDGTEKWTLPIPARWPSSAVGADGTIYARR